jgi:ligand-binding sensor domain-containing protein
MRLILLHLIFWKLIFLCCSANAREYAYLHYNIKDGLAASNVHCIAQDNDGYIWLATETGLSRFDGTHFTTFTRADGLPSNEILSLMTDQKGRMWIGSFKNAPCYYYKGKFYTGHNDPALKTVSFRSDISGYAETTDGTILICNYDKVYVLPPDGRPAVLYQGQSLQEMLPGMAIRKTSSSLRKQFVPLSDRLALYADQRFEWFYPPSGNGNSGFTLKAEDSMVIVPADRRNARLKMFRALRYAYYLNDSVLVLIHRYGGASLWDIRREKSMATYLADFQVQHVFRDREGNFWFGTNNDGLFRLNRYPFVNYRFGKEKTSLPVKEIYGKSGELYVAVAKGGLWQMLPGTNGAGPLWSRAVQVRKSAAWAMRQLQRRYINYGNSDVFRLFPSSKGIVDPGIKTVQFLGDTLFCAAFGGAFCYRVRDMKMLDTIYLSRATCAFKSGNTFYVGTLEGLYAVHNKHTRYYGTDFPLLKNRISAFAEGRDSILWVATYEEGVVGLKQGHIVAHIDQAGSGMSSNISRCLFADRGVLWIGTDKGINKVPLAGKSRYKVNAVYRTEDGLPSEIINAIYAEDSIVYAGTESGLSVFDESKAPRHAMCRIYMTEIAVNGALQQINTGVMVLPPGKNNIRFRFAGISFLSPSLMSYRYRLLGLQEQWQSSNDPVLNFASLPPGKYTLQVMAINKYGDRSSIVAQQLEIQSLLWEKAGFRILVAASLLILILMALQVRIRRIKKKEAESRSIQQQIMQLEQMALRAQMNPHFIFNCLNSIQNFILSQDVAGANFYLGRFASLVRQTLDNAAQIYLTLAEEIKYLTSYLELERLQTLERFTYNIIVGDEVDPSQVRVPNMVIQPFVENAIKHGVAPLQEGGNILVHFSALEDGWLQCVIEDNGPGLPDEPVAERAIPAARSNSGSTITLKRIDILNQLSEQHSITLDIRTVNGSAAKNRGTRVVLRFPYNKT